MKKAQSSAGRFLFKFLSVFSLRLALAACDGGGGDGESTGKVVVE
ncbi:MAG: hypothetical protein ACE5F7_10545 [Nitrospiria bacterium]